jgi:hypothetical protein
VSSATKTPTSTQSTSSAGVAEQQLGYAAFAHLLDQHPRRLTIDQLGQEIGGADQVALERAVASLDEACLLQRQGSELIPAPAALRVAQAR